VVSKLGRIHSNLFDFRLFEFVNLNPKIEFGRIRPIWSKSTKFDHLVEEIKLKMNKISMFTALKQTKNININTSHYNKDIFSLF